jgi:hypothetical protein
MSPPDSIRPTGSLTTHRPDEVLRFCEHVRFTGTLAFQSDRGRGVLPLLNGVPEIAVGDAKLEHALDEFLALERGTYTLVQLLPALEGASPEGDLGLRGALARVAPADLLRYCEAAGLTGTLTLQHGERTCVARYRRGELVSLTVDNEADADLGSVFAWTEGIFTIQARSVFDQDRPATVPHDKMLKTLEVALVDILEQSQRRATEARPATPTTPIAAPSIQRTVTLPFGVEESGASPPPAVSPRPASVAPGGVRRSVPPPPPGPESTVKVYFVDRGPPRHPSGTQHAAARLGTEVLPLDPESQKLPALDHAAAPPPRTQPVPTPEAPAAPVAAPPESASAPAPRAAEPVPPVPSTPPLHRALTGLFAGTLAVTVIAGLYILGTLVR